MPPCPPCPILRGCRAGGRGDQDQGRGPGGSAGDTHLCVCPQPCYHTQCWGRLGLWGEAVLAPALSLVPLSAGAGGDCASPQHWGTQGHGGLHRAKGPDPGPSGLPGAGQTHPGGVGTLKSGPGLNPPSAQGEDRWTHGQTHRHLLSSWMHGAASQTHGQVHVQTDTWVGGSCTYIQMDSGTASRTHGQLQLQADRWTVVHPARHTDSCTYSRTHRRVYGQMHGWLQQMGGGVIRTHGQVHVQLDSWTVVRPDRRLYSSWKQ